MLVPPSSAAQPLVCASCVRSKQQHTRPCCPHTPAPQADGERARTHVARGGERESGVRRRGAAAAHLVVKRVAAGHGAPLQQAGRGIYADQLRRRAVVVYGRSGAGKRSAESSKAAKPQALFAALLRLHSLHPPIHRTASDPPVRRLDDDVVLLLRLIVVQLHQGRAMRPGRAVFAELAHNLVRCCTAEVALLYSCPRHGGDSWKLATFDVVFGWGVEGYEDKGRHRERSATKNSATARAGALRASRRRSRRTG